MMYGSRRLRALAALCMAIALLAGVAAALGVFARGSGDTATAVSIRGERFEYVTDGIYVYNAERIVAEGVGWDAVTLFLVAPMLLLTAWRVSRGSLRARLIALGLLGYVFYQYFMYALYWALGPLLPVFIVLFTAAGAAIVWTVTTIDMAGLPGEFTGRFPRKAMAVFSAAVGLLLVGMWSQRIATALSGDVQGILYGASTLSVQVLDLGVVVPLAFATAVLIWKRRPIGYLLAPALAVKGVTMAAAICAMLIVAASVEGSLEVGGFVTFAVITVASGLLAYRMFASAKADSDKRGRQAVASPAQAG